ncbi:MAG: hypothetical protein U1E52_16750 [Geminicoccaceae bacterium]
MLRVCACPGLADRAQNPYTWLIYQPMLAQGVRLLEYRRWLPELAPVHVLHVHWPDFVFWGRIARRHPSAGRLAAHKLLAFARSVRRRGGVIVWTAHNLQPHDIGDESWRAFFDRWRGEVDLVIHLTTAARQEFARLYPDMARARHAVIPHPHYRTAYPAPPPRDRARERLQIDPRSRVLCNIGNMRPYKRLAELVRLFRSVAQERDLLVLAGECGPAYRDELAAASGGDRRVRVQPHRHGDAEMIELLAASDGSVINHQTLFNSGSAILSLSFDRPVLARRQGSMAELAAALGPRWVDTFDGELRPDRLADFLDRAAAARHDERAPLAPYEPVAVSDATLKEYRDALASRGTRLR